MNPAPQTIPTTPPPSFERETLRAAVRETYTEVAASPACGFHFLSGPPLAERLGYPEELLRHVPPTSLASFAGVGNPFSAGPLRRGETVLDVGCGAGTDLFVAAWLVGPTGRVIGVDMTPAMLDRARQGIAARGLHHVELREGTAEAMPLANASVDVAISNGAINLCPDKLAVFQELFRVVRSGGRLQIADVLVDTAVPPRSRDLVHLWTGCVAGGTPVAEYLELLRHAGFADVALVANHDAFRGTEVEHDAGRFGARGGVVVARRP